MAGLRLTDPRALALLAVLCVFRLLPRGFTNADLRRHLAPLLGPSARALTVWGGWSAARSQLRKGRHPGSFGA